MTATLERNHDALCREIEQGRIDDETPSTMGPSKSSWLPLGRRRHTYSIDKTIPETDPSTDHSYAPSYVPLKGSPQLQQKRSIIQSYGRSHSLDLTALDRVPDLPKSEDHTDAGRMKEGFLMTGWLHKTSRPKNSKTRGHSRQRRKFRLTAHSLEYSHQLQKVELYRDEYCMRVKPYTHARIIYISYNATEAQISN